MSISILLWDLMFDMSKYVYDTKGVLAESNAQLVERAVRIIREAGFEPATPEDVRKQLKLIEKKHNESTIKIL